MYFSAAGEDWKAMNSAETLKLNKDFKRLYYRGRSIATKTVVVTVGKNNLGRNRIGLTCGKIIGKAYMRNRAKRLMRESYRLLKPRVKQGFDIVLIARTQIKDKKCDAVLKDIRYALFKLDMMI